MFQTKQKNRKIKKNKINNFKKIKIMKIRIKNRIKEKWQTNQSKSHNNLNHLNSKA